MTAVKNSNVLPIDFDPVEEILEHVNQLALWSPSPSVHTFVERAFYEFDAFEVPVSVDVVGKVMETFFGSPHYAAADHESLTPSELSILYPGVTSKLLCWYVSLS